MIFNMTSSNSSTSQINSKFINKCGNLLFCHRTNGNGLTLYRSL